MKELKIIENPSLSTIKPLVGQTFGNYTIISDKIASDKNGKTYWLVKCNCGNEVFVRQDILKSNQARKCRVCSNKEKFKNNVDLGKMHTKNYSPKHYGVGDLPRNIFTHYRNGAKLRNLEFSISIEYCWELFQKQKGKCALTGEDIWLRPKDKTSTVTCIKNGNRNLDYSKFNASLDRIDSSKGYIEENVQWVKREVNIMKMDLSQEEFIEICKKVTNHVNQQPSQN